MSIVFLPNLPAQKRWPRKKKKAYIRRMGPNCYKQMLMGCRILTSDYAVINGVTYAPWNKKVTRKIKWNIPKMPVNSRYVKVNISNEES